MQVVQEIDEALLTAGVILASMDVATPGQLMNG